MSEFKKFKKKLDFILFTFLFIFVLLYFFSGEKESKMKSNPNKTFYFSPEFSSSQSPIQRKSEVVKEKEKKDEYPSEEKRELNEKDIFSDPEFKLPKDVFIN